MEQLIFIGIILFFSVMEAALRKKKAGGEEPTLEAPPGGVPEARRGSPPDARLPEARPPGTRVPSYDEDASFDDAVGAGSRTGEGRAGRASSEGLIPADVWEEIQAMARGGKAPARTPPPSPAPVPKPVPKPAPRPAPRPAPTRAPSSGVPARAQRSAPAPMSTEARKNRPPTVPEVDVVAPEHTVHLAHAKYGKPVQDRLTGFDDTHKPRGLSAEATALRRVLRGERAGLRQAILLQEILGPPVSLKDDPSAG